MFIEFKTIRDFAGHAFHLYTGERLNDMVESVRQNGILQPLIVRRIHDDPEFDYEMLSGHNRKNAAVIAGLDGALCLVKEGISDEEAIMYVVETNLMQRSFFGYAAQRTCCRAGHAIQRNVFAGASGTTSSVSFSS